MHIPSFHFFLYFWLSQLLLQPAFDKCCLVGWPPRWTEAELNVNHERSNHSDHDMTELCENLKAAQAAFTPNFKNSKNHSQIWTHLSLDKQGIIWSLSRANCLLHHYNEASATIWFLRSGCTHLKIGEKIHHVTPSLCVISMLTVI